MSNSFEDLTNIFTKPVKGRQGELYGVVVNFLRGKGFKFEEILGESSIIFYHQGNNGQVMCVVSILEDSQAVVFTSLYPRSVSAEKRRDIILLLTRINFGLPLGNFELGMDDNFVAYQTAINVGSAHLTPALLQHIVDDNLIIIDRYIPEINKLLDQQMQAPLYGLSSPDEGLLRHYLPVLIHDGQISVSGNDDVSTISGTEPMIYLPLSIRNIYLARQCPRSIYLEYRNPENLDFVSDSREGIIAGLFWQLSAAMGDKIRRDTRCQILFEPEGERLKSEDTAQNLQSLLYKIFFFPYLQEEIKKDKQKISLINQVWESLVKLLKLWTQVLVNNRHHCSYSELFEKTFVSDGPAFNHTFVLSGEEKQPLTADLIHSFYKIDDRTLYIPVYPLNNLEEPDIRKVKLALSAYLLHKSLHIPIDRVSETQFPTMEETHYSWPEIEKTIAEIIPTLTSQIHQWLNWKTPATPPPAAFQTQLCQICPKEKECIETFKTTITPKDNDLDTIVKPLVSALNAFGVKVNDEGTTAIAAPAFIRVQVKPKLGVKVSSIINLAPDLQVQLGFADTPLIQPQAGYVSIDIPRPDRQIARFEDYISKEIANDGKFKIAIGIDLNGKLVEANLADANNCHFLVAGTSGSGKSEFLRALLLSLLVRHSPDDLRIVLVDPKRVTFPEFENIPWLYSPIIKDTEPAIELMENLVDEMESRYKLLEVSKSNDLETYNKRIDRSRQKVQPRIVCIFDEYADFMIDKVSKNALEDSIKRLGAKARAAGIHLVIATQRPDAKVVTPLIRANLPARVALKTASGADSAIILGDKQTDACRLLGKGDLLYLTGGQLLRLQSLYSENCQL